MYVISNLKGESIKKMIDSYRLVSTYENVNLFSIKDKTFKKIELREIPTCSILTNSQSRIAVIIICYLKAQSYLKR